jgi:hypothetical protein
LKVFDDDATAVRSMLVHRFVSYSIGDAASGGDIGDIEAD